MRPHGRTVEEELALIAHGQHGLATRKQLLDAGVSATGIRRRVHKGTLLPEYPGVYRIGHRAPSVDATYLAAVLACGDGALLSGPAAAHLHRLRKGAAPRPMVTTRSERRVAGVTTRRSRHLEARDATRVRGIPVTIVSRTLVDLAAVLSIEDLARACHEAGVLHGTSPAHIEAVLVRRPTSPGATKLRRVLRGDVRVTLSALERRFLELLKEVGLPLPQTNRRVGARRVDCHWPEHRLTVELDSYRFHSSRHAWEHDRRREREARALGNDFRRYTYEDVFGDPGWMIRELSGLLRPNRPA